jgi:hypothetical protein
MSVIFDSADHNFAPWSADALIAAELKRLNRPANYPVTGFAWKAALQFRNAWDALPA